MRTRRSIKPTTLALLGTGLFVASCGPVGPGPSWQAPARKADSNDYVCPAGAARSDGSWRAAFTATEQDGAVTRDDWPHVVVGGKDELLLRGSGDAAVRPPEDLDTGNGFTARFDKRHCFNANVFDLSIDAAPGAQVALGIDNQLLWRGEPSAAAPQLRWQGDGRCVMLSVQYSHPAESEESPHLALRWSSLADAHPYGGACGGDAYWTVTYPSSWPESHGDPAAGHVDAEVPFVDFDWGHRPPSTEPTLVKTHCFTAGRYAFTVEADDWATLTVAGEELISRNRWDELGGKPVAWQTDQAVCVSLEVRCRNVSGDASLSLRWDRDADADGVIDIDDACPQQPGTLSNGCPSDKDRDGIYDPDDRCPHTAYPSGDGCPPPSCSAAQGDADGVALCPSAGWRVEHWEHSQEPGVAAGGRYLRAEQSYQGFNPETVFGIEVLWHVWSPWPDAPDVLFSSRWTRNLWFERGGCFKVRLSGDDGIRFGVDNTGGQGDWAIDRWWGDDCTPGDASCRHTVDYETYLVWIPAGWRTLRLEQVERGGAARAQLNWKRVGDITEPRRCKGRVAWGGDGSPL